MAELFHPVPNLRMLCAHCGKIHPATLDRSIAANGRTIDRLSSFEYLCSKCQRVFSFVGKDLLELVGDKPAAPAEPREYSPKLHFVIGEVIYHKKFKEKGLVVCKRLGTPSRIAVDFEKSGVRLLVEDT